MPEKYDLVLLSHHKCATNWLRSICKILDERGVISSHTVHGKDKSEKNEKSAGVANVLINVNASKSTTSNIDFKAQPVMHIVRDPRDALVSNYWSWLKSHSNNGANILKFREEAANLSVQEGMKILMDYFPMGTQLSSWTDEMWENSTRIRYEDMLEDLPEQLKKMFEPVGVEIPDDALAELMERTSFAKMSKGRKPGEEDVENHFRKGVSGDWVNYFEADVSKKFYDNYGGIARKLGYSA